MTITEVLAIPVLGLRIRRQNWHKEHILFCALMEIATFGISKRSQEIE